MEEDREERYKKLIGWFNNSPYARYLGMEVTDLAEGYAKVSLRVRSDFHNWEERTHGGLIMSLADQAFGCSLNTLDQAFVAVQFNINFLAATAEDDTIVAESRVVHAGRSIGMAEIVVCRADGKIIARATGTVQSIGKRH